MKKFDKLGALGNAIAIVEEFNENQNPTLTEYAEAIKAEKEIGDIILAIGFINVELNGLAATKICREARQVITSLRNLEIKEVG